MIGRDIKKSSQKYTRTLSVAVLGAAQKELPPTDTRQLIENALYGLYGPGPDAFWALTYHE